MSRLQRFLPFMSDYRALLALFFWPKFSLSSYSLVSALVQQGIAPKTVLDLGANVGQFTVASSKLFKNVSVHSFEPVPASLKALRANVAGLNNVIVNPIALGDEEGEIEFHVNSHSQSSSALSLAQSHRNAFPDAQETETIKVPLSTLDKSLKGMSFESPVLLKLDVQGYESKVILGGAQTLQQVDYVVLETSFKPMYRGEVTFREILEIMENSGFLFARPVAWLTSSQNTEILQMDALFVRDSTKQTR